MNKLIPALLVVILATSGIVLVCKLLSGAVGLVASFFNLILGLGVVLAVVLIVIWMFSYAKRKK